MTTRIAVTSDTHCRAPDGSDLPAALLDGLAGADLIVHLGDLTSCGVLDRLERIAPVVAVRSFADRAPDARIDESLRVVEREGTRLGLVNALEAPIDTQTLMRGFGGPVDVVLFGGTHAPLVAVQEGVLLVNPGSPTLPAGACPTFARLELERGQTRVEVVALPC